MKKNLDQFNDVALQKIARGCYYGKPSYERTSELEGILKKESLSNQERNQLLFLIESSRYMKPASIVSMKKEIFEIIGYESSNQYGTLNRRELEAIYNFIVTKKDSK